MVKFLLGVLAVVGVLVYVGIHALSGVDARVERVHANSDVNLVDGLPDAGVVVEAIVKNAGNRGVIRTKVHLSTSEGEWDREQSLVFEAGEERELSWFFHEPTINASNIQSRVSVTP